MIVVCVMRIVFLSVSILFVPHCFEFIMAPTMAAMKKLKIQAKNADKTDAMTESKFRDHAALQKLKIQAKNADNKDAMTETEFQVHAALQMVRMEIIKNRLRFA